MHTKRRLALSLLMAGGIMAISGSAISPNSITQRAATPGGSIWLMGGQIVDQRSGFTYNVSIIAEESEDTAGIGIVTLLVEGPGLTLCSARGPAAEIDFSTGGDDYSGNSPLGDIQCGTSYGMSVAIEKCAATIEMHGYVHSDFPLVTYMGMMTTDMTLQSGKGTQDGLAQIVIHTPKDDIKLGGVLTGDLTIDTCP